MNDFGKKAFDIGDIPKNIDLNVPPATGLDYLYRVRLETKKCPKIVVADIDTTKFLDRQTVKVDFCNGFIPAPEGFEPDPGWQREELELFRHYKTHFFGNRESLKVKFPKKDYPKLTKENDWCLYCLGPEKHDKIYNDSMSEASEDDLSASKAKRSRLSQKGNPPLLSIVLYLNQRWTTRLLSYQINWLEEAGFSHDQGAWLYALLVCLEKPLDPDTCSLLRSLSRLCSGLRFSVSSPEDETLKSLNLLICIIAEHFEQIDMTDKFASVNKDSK